MQEKLDAFEARIEGRFAAVDAELDAIARANDAGADQAPLRLRLDEVDTEIRSIKRDMNARYAVAA